MNRVSIIMPCYNDGKYIEESIDSAEAQTYSDIEIIVIDDGSDDEQTLSILSALQKQKRCQLITTNHVGPSKARNAGIAAAKGKYILPLDADDVIDPSYIEKAVHIMSDDPEIGAVYCFAELFGERTGRWELPDYSFKSMLLDNIVFVTALYLKSDWEKVGGYRECYTHGMEDYDFWLSILELGKRIHQIPEVLFFYRIKPVSRTVLFSNSLENMQNTYRDLYQNHLAFYEKHQHEYAMLLRDALISKINETNELQQKRVALENQLNQTPSFTEQVIRKLWYYLKKLFRR